MSHEAGVRYQINDQDEIVFVDAAWDQFAVSNDGEELVADGILGRVLWDFISDEVTRQLYQQIVARVRHGNRIIFKLRCDSPSYRRHLEVRVQVTPAGNVEFATRTLKIEERSPIALLSKRIPRSSDLIRTCSWCNRIHVDSGEWMEVEDAVQQLGIFDAANMPQLTHGMCEDCYASINSSLADDEVRE